MYFRYNNTISGAYQPPHPQQSAPLYQPQYNQMHLSIFPLQTPGLVQVIILFPASHSTSGLVQSPGPLLDPWQSSQWQYLQHPSHHAPGYPPGKEIYKGDIKADKDKT